MSRGAVAGALLAAGIAAGAGHAAAPASPDAVLDFELSDGQRFIRLTDLPARPTVVNFWRSDCPACLRELPVLDALARRTDVIRVATIALERQSASLTAPPAIRALLAPPLLSLYAPGAADGLLARFGNPGGALPYTIVLDRQRRPCARRLGELDAAWLNRAVDLCLEPNR